MMRVLGIDFGDKTLGLAVSDALGITAQPLEQYRIRGPEDDRSFFLSLVSQHRIGKIVIGLPLRMDGTEGTRVDKTRRFADWLKSILDLPVVFWDERLTTKQALSILREQNSGARKKKQQKDQVSAALILAAYLESERDDPPAA